MPGRTLLALLGACLAGLVLAAPSLALDIADASPPSGAVGVPYSYTFQLSPGSGSPGASWSIDTGALPPGLRLSSNDRTATVYGTPTQAGAFSFFVKVRDAPGPWVCCTEEQFTIVIDPGLDITASSDLPAGSVGAAYGYQLATAGGNASAWVITSGSLPAGMQFTPDGAIVGTPMQAALSRIVVRAVDGSRSASKQLTLKVTEPVVATGPAATAVKLGRQFLMSFAVKGGLGPYTWSGVELPQGIGVNPSTGQVGGRPKVAGPLTVAVQVTDALGTSGIARATVNVATRLSIAGVRLPVARDGKRFSAKVLTSGGAGPFTLRLAGSKPGWLRFDSATGQLSGKVKLKLRKPLVVERRTKKGVKRIVTHRPPLALTYNLYLTATDSLGQRSTQRLKLSVRP
ncbi:MAG TPA: Ig domain-containing protein [Gaiella sp.]|uniref:Ig domain-containing protein n=1 Tax=Gaiella sp. TaxID=2663207 RepID=UPI002D7E7A02|nr:Ig domain-containing protein [Gaiella sp.]HET9288773.1 Ig domain-containing protein [Gaiella sp.]